MNDKEQAKQALKELADIMKIIGFVLLLFAIAFTAVIWGPLYLFYLLGKYFYYAIKDTHNERDRK